MGTLNRCIVFFKSPVYCFALFHECETNLALGPTCLLFTVDRPAYEPYFQDSLEENLMISVMIKAKVTPMASPIARDCELTFFIVS